MEERRVWQKHIFVSARKAGITDSGILHELVGVDGGDVLRGDEALVLGKDHADSFGVAAGDSLIRDLHEEHSIQKRNIDETLPLCSGIIKRELKIDARSKEPFVWLTYQNGGTLIERLKKYVENAEKRNLRGD